MPNLSTQLREYFDATAPPLEVEEVVSDEVWVPTRRKTPSRRWTAPSWAYGMATMVVVLVLILGLALLVRSGNENEVVEPTPTTVAPDVDTMTDLEIIEAGVDALYSGDADRAVEFFELHGLFPDSADENDEWIRDEVAYQAAIEGRVTVDCNEKDTPGMFTCTWIYHNAFTDAIGYVERRVDTVPGRHVYGDTLLVVVDDGVITTFSEFPFHDWEHNPITIGLEAFLGEKVDEPPANSDSLCSFGYPWTMRGPLSGECVDFVLDHLDEWAAWAETNLELPDTPDR